MNPAAHSHPPALKTLLIFLGFIVFVAIYGTLLCGFWMNYLSLRDVVSDGFQTTATLDNKYIDDNARYWLTYRFTTRFDDTYISSIKVRDEIYHRYQVGDLLPMRYSIENPYYNALDDLQEDIRGDLWHMLRLSLIVITISIGLGIGWLHSIHLKSTWQKLKPHSFRNRG